MDLSTISGFVVGLACIAGGIVCGGDVAHFVDLHALLIVVGGVIAAAFIRFPAAIVMGTFKVASKAFTTETLKLDRLVNQLVALSRHARTDGILALEEAEKEIDNAFLKKGIELAVDGNEESLVRFIMTTDISSTRQRHAVGRGVLRSMGLMAPAFGVAGTLAGLAQLFQAMDGAAALGPALGLSLLPLFYGVLLASLVFLPLAAKLEFRSEEEALRREVITEGIIAIMQGVSPRVLKDKLEAFVEPGLRREKRDSNWVAKP